MPQFLSGGWLENNLPEGHLKSSGTFVFPIDIAPTLLEMAGADKSYLLDDRTGPVYGNGVWEYIKQSVVPGTAKETHQMEREVSYRADLFFDVKLNETIKNMYVGLQPQFMPRHWDPIWPKNGDLLMDFGYVSVQPCRPNGTADDCC